MKILKMTFELGAIVLSMGLYKYKLEKYRKYIFFVWFSLGLSHLKILATPLKSNIFFKLCLVYGICQKRIGNAKNVAKIKLI